MNGAHPDYLPLEDDKMEDVVEIRSPSESVDILECFYCSRTTSGGCDCILEEDRENGEESDGDTDDEVDDE